MKPKLWTGVLATIAAVLVIAPGSASASFPGSNGKLVTSENDEGGDYWIATRQPPYTGAETELTLTSLGAENAIWSAEGARIAFDDNQDGGIWLMNADGSNQHELVAPTNPLLGLIPTGFSPDGRHLLYSKNQSPAIREMNIDGAHRHVLESPPSGSQDFGAKFSPNGRWIIFGRNSQIWKMRANGTHQVRLARNAGAPDWSPSGKKIVFSRVVTAEGFAGIFTMTARGTHQVEIARPRAGVANLGAPSWAPNGRFIVFDKATIDGTSVYRMRPDGSHRTLLVLGFHGALEPDAPSIQPLP